MDLGGAQWLFIDVGFVIILAAGLGYGAWQWHRIEENRRAKIIRDEVARQNYEEVG